MGRLPPCEGRSPTSATSRVSSSSATPGRTRALQCFEVQVQPSGAERTLRLRFADLPGHVTFISHWHMAIAMAALDEIRRGGEVVRRAEIRVPGGAREVRHPVRLPDGEYRVVVRAGAAVFERTVTVSEAGTIVLPLGVP